jgi:hypothetical protein
MGFPPPQFFEAMVEAVASDPERFRRLGSADLRLCILVEGDGGKQVTYGLILDGYDIEAPGQVDRDTFAPQVTVRGPEAAWEAMAADAAAHGTASGGQTLNALTLMGTPLTIEAEDPLGRDRFFRYAETLQALFDAAATRALQR